MTQQRLSENPSPAVVTTCGREVRTLVRAERVESQVRGGVGVERKRGCRVSG